MLQHVDKIWLPLFRLFTSNIIFDVLIGWSWSGDWQPRSLYSTSSSLLVVSPRGLTFTWWGCCGLCFWHESTKLAHSFLFCSCVYFYLSSPFNCISFHKFSWQLSTFSVCSSSLISALLVLSTIYLCMKVSSGPGIILCVWLGLKHHLII